MVITIPINSNVYICVCVRACVRVTSSLLFTFFLHYCSLIIPFILYIYCVSVTPVVCARVCISECAGFALLRF